MDDYRQKLQTLADNCSVCRDCPHGGTATQSVFAKGDSDSSLVFVGEASGESEDKAGIPFVGESGQLLDRMIARMQQEGEKLGIRLPNPYICNVVKHRPPGNKLLKSGEDIRACASKLFEQLNLLPNVRVIVALGRVATQTLLGCDEAIGKLRGRSFHNSRTGDKLVWMDDSKEAEFIADTVCGCQGIDPTYYDLPNSSSEWRDPNRRITVVPTWHPSYLLHQPNLMKPRHQCWSDLQLALKHLDTDDDIPF